ncbi:nucleoside phosphorylase [Undibacterium sp. GrIS 1.8]|uniref:5'-methylthioadenosine/S-adenosylhomocysteine nucleosidase family protein n=1 Tax=Undibacterium sp. GrIS 1.8 TaxID=3143934 RepID=UPI003397FEFC
MKIMLIEDDNSKSKAIIGRLKSQGISENDVIHARNMTDFAAKLNSNIVLFIIDFKLPSVDKGVAYQNGRAILETIIKAGKNDALLLAISSYPGDFPELRNFYESNGCILADYSNKKSWQSTLDHLIIQIKKNLNFDFIIFCALQKERNPYITLLPGKKIIRSGIDCYDISLEGKKGTVILMPQMGLVNAAITASLCIDRFKPSVVGMSGICGGFSDRAKMGQLFISSMAYEYQSGKWTDDRFSQEPYQVPTDHTTLTKLKELIDSDDLVSELEEGFGTATRPNTVPKPEAGIFTSGSAVIASEDFLSKIEAIHRKVNALDMEIFSIHRAAELSPYSPSCICAKTVVDLCGEAKNDELHLYGSHISARFLIKAIQHFFA